MSIHDRVADAMGSAPVSSVALPGGSTGQIEKSQLADGRVVVVKYGNNNCGLEARMLQSLSTTHTLPLPDILHAEQDLLILSWIDNDGQITDDVQRELAKHLAQLHQQPVPAFGYIEDTTIGALAQPNPQSDEWIGFFGQYRLLHRAKSAYDLGRLAPSLMPRLDALVQRLPELIPGDNQPSLLHGDLWSGNVLCHQGRLTGIIDPAIYWGDAEIELAYLPMFGGFNGVFYESYRQYRPMAQDFFETRMPLYQLWPLLVHVELYAGSYNESVDGHLRRLGF